MAREGTKAHQLSLRRRAADGLIRRHRMHRRGPSAARASTAAYELGGELVPPRTLPQSAPLRAAGCSLRSQTWNGGARRGRRTRLPQGYLHRLPTSTGEEDDDEDDDEEGLATASKWAADKKRKKKADAGADAKDSKSDGEAGQGGGDGGGGDGTPRVEEFLKGRLSVWQPALPLAELGLDSLDLHPAAERLPEEIQAERAYGHVHERTADARRAHRQAGRQVLTMVRRDRR